MYAIIERKKKERENVFSSFIFLNVLNIVKGFLCLFQGRLRTNNNSQL